MEDETESGRFGGGKGIGFSTGLGVLFAGPHNKD